MFEYSEEYDCWDGERKIVGNNGKKLFLMAQPDADILWINYEALWSLTSLARS